MDTLEHQAAEQTSQSASNATDERPQARFHRRTLIIGALLIAVIAYVALYVDLVVGQMQMGVLQFAPGAVGAFFLVYIVARLARRSALLGWMNSADLLVLYLMLFVGVLTCTRGLIEKLLPALAYINAYATPDNAYVKFFPYLNPDLVVGDPRGHTRQYAAASYFDGSGRASLPWNAWIVPCATWMGLFLLVLICFVCMAAILRRQWSDVERLTFPHTVLPLELMDDSLSKRLFSNRLTWLGVAVPTVIYAINGLHQSFPAVPQIPLDIEGIQAAFTTPPWNGMYLTSIYISFAALGFAYLLPSDVLFSLWFFFALTRLTDVIAAAYDWNVVSMNSYPTRAYLGYQAAGAYFALAAIFMYSGRAVFAKILRSAWSFRTVADDDDELLPARVAVWGLVFGFIGIMVWSCWAGMSLWFAAAVWLIYLLVTTVVLTRGVSQAGLLMTETSFRPSDVVSMFVAKSSWGLGNMVPLAMLNAVIFRDTRGILLTVFMDAQQMAGNMRIKRRSLLAPLAIGVIVALIVGAATHLRLSYTHGAVNLYSYGVANAGWAYDDAAASVSGGGTPFPSAPAWFAAGFGVVLFLTKMRAAFTGFPLQPIAYALAPTWTMYVLWFPVLVTWAIKSLLLRYGGQKAYRQFLPLFLGLIIGEFGSAAIWAILATCFHLTAPPLPLP